MRIKEVQELINYFLDKFKSYKEEKKRQIKQEMKKQLKDNDA